MAINIKNPEFRASIKARRLELGLTLQELSARTGIHYQHLSRIENGKQSAVYEDTVARLARGLNLPFSQLLALIQAPDSPPSISWRERVQAWINQNRRWGFAALLPLTFYLLLGIERREPTRVEIDGKALIWRGTGSGEILHRHSFDATIGTCKAVPWSHKQLLAVGLLNDGIDGGQFCLIDQETRQVVLADVPDMQAISGYYQDLDLNTDLFSVDAIDFCEFDGSGEDEIVIMRRHAWRNPSYILILDRDLAVIGTYFHRGHINVMHITDLNGDGRDEIYAAGAHNPSKGASAFILDRDHCSGFAQDPYQAFRADLADSSLARLILPGFEQKYLDQLAEPRLEFVSLRPHQSAAGGNQLTLRINNDGGDALTVMTDALLNPALDSIESTDRFKQRFQGILAEGRIDRDISSPEFLDAWLGDYLHFTTGRQDHPALSAQAASSSSTTPGG